jgi:predicted NUDIX family phosphoesterase
MSKDDQNIMVIERKKLFNGEIDAFQGFSPASRVDFESRILDNYTFMRRGDVETDPSLKQPIAYSIITNPSEQKVFAYQRSSSDKNYKEKRLQGKYSWGIGGHIQKSDCDEANPIWDSMMRETREEVTLDGFLNPKVLGYINDDLDSVGKVHFGVLYTAETNSKAVSPKDPEIDNGALMTIGQLDEICSSKDCSVENWSKIALDALKENLKVLSNKGF